MWCRVKVYKQGEAIMNNPEQAFNYNNQMSSLSDLRESAIKDMEIIMSAVATRLSIVNKGGESVRPYEYALGIFDTALIGVYMDESKGNKSKVSRDLMINRSTLLSKAVKLGLTRRGKHD
jgi:DNA-binding protein Fis